LTKNINKKFANGFLNEGGEEEANELKTNEESKKPKNSLE
jgi:hypothetical protein